VINALSDMEHPTQAIADILTIKEHKGLKGVKAAFVGDGNNVCNSLILACAYAGVEIAVACPRGYEPNALIIKRAKLAGGKVTSLMILRLLFRELMLFILMSGFRWTGRR